MLNLFRTFIVVTALCMAINTCQAKTLTTEERVSKIEVSLQKQLDKVNNSKQDNRIKDVRATYLAKIVTLALAAKVLSFTKLSFITV